MISLLLSVFAIVLSAASQECDSIFASGDRDLYLAECVPDTYMAIPCPVMRGLMGSGFLRWHSNDGGVPVSDILAALEQTLGVVGDMFNDLSALADAIANDREEIDLLTVAELVNHGASSGIIGAATGGALADNDEFNEYEFHQLLALSFDGNYFTPSEWGEAVTMFGKARKAEADLPENLQEDVAWHSSPFHWITLGLEYSNVFTIFKDNDDTLSMATVTSLWKNGKMPDGWTKALRPLDMGPTAESFQLMKVEIDDDVVEEMQQEHYNDDDDFAGIKGYADLLCGTEYQHCKKQNECDDNQLNACFSYPCIDLREGPDHHHMMVLNSNSEAMITYYDKNWNAGPEYTCSRSGPSYSTLVGVWDCHNFYSGTVTISADYADDFTPARINDHIDVCHAKKLCPVALNGCDGAWGSFNYVQFNTRHTAEECREKCESSNGDCEVYFHNKLNGRCLLMLPGALSGCTGSSDEWQGRPLVCGTDSNLCCRAYNADCLSCAQGLSVDEFCRQHLQDFVPGCEHVIEPLCPVALNGCDGAWGSFNYVQFNTRHTAEECREKCESSNGDCEVYFHNKLNGRCLLMLPGALSGCTGRTGSSDVWQGRPLVCGKGRRHLVGRLLPEGTSL